MNKKEQSGVLTALKLIGNIVSWTALVLLILVAGFLLYYIISSQIYATKGEKYAPKFSLYTIVSPSMVPNIKVYDIVVDERVDDPTKLKVGDVITFISTSSISNGMTITHRIVDVIQTDSGPQFKTKGDANITSDYALVTPDKVIGKVAFRVPQLGRIQFFLSSKGGWVLLILIPALLIILADVFKLTNLVDIKKRVQKVEKNDELEEEASQEKLMEEYNKQQQLKKELQAKTNKNKYRKNKYEEDGFLDSTPEVIVTIESKDDHEEIIKLKETPFESVEDLYDDEMIIDDKDDEYIYDEKLPDETVNDQNNKGNQSDEDIDLDAIRARLEEDEDDEIELPLKIELREEIIPEDMDLPVIKK